MALSTAATCIIRLMNKEIITKAKRGEKEAGLLDYKPQFVKPFLLKLKIFAFQYISEPFPMTVPKRDVRVAKAKSGREDATR